MCYSKVSSEIIEKLRTNLHKGVDTVCDHLECNRKDQVPLAIKEMEDQLNEDLLEVVDVHCRNHNQESTPFVLKELQELRRRNHCREQKSSGPDQETEGPGVEQPGESFWSFEGILQRLKPILQMVLKLVQELTALCKSVESILSGMEKIFSVAQSF